MAVEVVAPGHGAEQRKREGLERDAGVVQLPPDTGDWVPDNESAPLHLLKENTPMATVDGDPGAAAHHRLGERGG